MRKNPSRRLSRARVASSGRHFLSTTHPLEQSTSRPKVASEGGVHVRPLLPPVRCGQTGLPPRERSRFPQISGVLLLASTLPKDSNGRGVPQTRQVMSQAQSLQGTARVGCYVQRTTLPSLSVGQHLLLRAFFFHACCTTVSRIGAGNARYSIQASCIMRRVLSSACVCSLSALRR